MDQKKDRRKEYEERQKAKGFKIRSFRLNAEEFNKVKNFILSLRSK